MRKLLLAISILVYTQCAASAFIEPRNLYQFSNMIKAVTGKDAWDYDNYGCYCGAGGCGTPVDATDRCCRAHDSCYYQADNAGCSPKIFNVYKYSASYGYAVCNDKPDTCDFRICTCDRVASLCFFNNIGSYNENYNNPLFFDTNYKCICKSQISLADGTDVEKNISEDEIEENSQEDVVVTK